MYLNKEQRDLINAYTSKPLLKKVMYMGKGLNIVDDFLEYINASYDESNYKYNKLVDSLWTEKISHIQNVFEGKNYGALKFLLGDYYAPIFKEIWNKATQYTYSKGYFRRSYRTNKSSELYLQNNIEKLKEITYLVANNFSIEEYFSYDKANYKGISIISDIIALEIDKKNSFVLDKLKEIISSENNTFIITREIIKGMLMSKSIEALKMIGELLLAAKRQEGLRQAIVESMDEGNKEAFIYILKIIIDNNLTRFSSISRAFSTWTGINLDIEKPKIIDKCFKIMYKCLTDNDYKNESISSKDNLQIYIGIWAIAFDEIEDIDEVVDNLINSDEKYKKLVALQFLYDTQFNIFKHKIASRVLEDKDFEVLALAVKNLFSSLTSYNLKQDREKIKYYDNENTFSRVSLFNELERIVNMMPKKEIEFRGSVFSWVNFKITRSEILQKMVFAAALHEDKEVIDNLIEYKEKMDVDTRQGFVEYFLNNPKTDKQRIALIELCGDRSSYVREAAFKLLNSLDLTKTDFYMVENLLKYKSGDLRKNAIKLLLNQPNKDILNNIRNLIDSNNENKRMAAIDLVSGMDGNPKYEKIYSSCMELITSRNNISQKEEILTKNIIQDFEKLKKFDNGFGLYNKYQNFNPYTIKKPQNFDIGKKFSMKNEEMIEILNKFSNLIHENREFEYEVENWDNSKTVITLGGSYYLRPFIKDRYELDNYPIGDKIRRFVELNNIDSWKLIQLNFYMKIISELRYNSYKSWYIDLLKSNFNFKNDEKLKKIEDDIPYYKLLTEYINLLVKEIPKNEKFEIGKILSKYIYTGIPKEKNCEEYLERKNYYYNRKQYIAESYFVNYWLQLMKNNYDSKTFIDYFNIAYNYYQNSNYNSNATLTLDNFGYALELKIIDENEIFKELMDRENSPENISIITNLDKYDRNNLSKYETLIGIGNIVVDTVANIEAQRGELNTEVTKLASKINKCYGVSVFSSIILALEKDSYIRGYNFISGDCTKKQMLSHLLKCCYPKAKENAKTLEGYLKNKKITNKQLIEAAMYSPQWLDIVSEYLGYVGLKSACWYFHAHVNEYFSDEKASIVSRYTPIKMDELKDGAFDQKWFIDAYNTLGEKNFKIVYNSAKYIAGGGLHKRSQLFADATLGKLDIEEIKSRVIDKRNKDYLLTYGLIPVKNKEDVLERYEYIQQFIKESKQFGNQRQASELRVANMALLNLALNAGYSDVNRLVWNMETLRSESMNVYFQPKKIEDLEIQLVIDSLGQVDISCKKNNKALKSIPSKLGKHEYIVKIKEIKKVLKNQHIRAKHSFEEAMENEEIFSVDEILNLSKNPILAPIIKNLVLKCGENFGYIQGINLVDYKDTIYKLKKEDNIIIAHPFHLYKTNCWSSYQKDAFLKKIVQPFKQVFRELYIPNTDELQEQSLSRRYAGHQIQPKKTVAVLKNRGWIASYEEGIQKVYYKKDIIATIYAVADWFSPADMESPTIEFVRFEDRKTYKPVPINKVSNLIFSEVMRDLDLVVSVAHVGGVDPEASLSTIEIRIVIVNEIIKLMKLSNVELKGKHAYINGSYGEYTVHLGSGVVHKMGTGAINILAIQSAHRGKIFLPFIDSDPRSAEIISKIILLSEDIKIKDPSILEQLDLR